MGFYREKTKDYFLLDTAVENVFIHEFMPSAPDKYVKVYLLALMHADLGAKLTTQDIARHLDMAEEDVLKAWTYWEKAGVIHKHMRGSEDHFDYDVSFVNLRQQMYGESEESSEESDQIGTMLGDPQIKAMIGAVEATTGRIYSSSEMQEILSWLSEFQVAPEVITRAFEYSHKARKSDVRYVAAVVRGWAEKGLRDADAVDEYLKKAGDRQQMVREIFRALGFSRNATEKERELIDSWFDELHMPLETVLAACDKTSGISSPNINYVNRVLINWKKENTGRTRRSGEEPPAKDLAEYYEKVRALEEAEAEKRRREVYAAVPRIREIDESLRQIGPELSRIIISGREDGGRIAEELKNKQEELQMEKAFLLTDNGYEIDHMDVRYRCPLCKDTGRLESGERCQCAEKISREEVDRLLTK